LFARGDHSCAFKIVTALFVNKKLCHNNCIIIFSGFLLTMPRRPNQLPTVQIPISTTPQVRDYLERLVPSGFYGKNSTEAAERVLARALEQMVKEGTLKKRPARS